ncbi:MAG: signal recognition particle receptor subunit alpha [Candidatus Aenigmatarchaeota archaeon]
MLEGLSAKLRAAIDRLSKGTDKATIDALLNDIQRALIAGDVDVRLARELTAAIRKRAFDKIPEGITRREWVISAVYDELARFLGGSGLAVSLKPKKVLLCGLFGSGKTSTAAKLARFYQKKGLRPGLVCCDTARPAAYEQLQQLAARIDVPFYGDKDEKNSALILKNALKQLKCDVLIVDSSGRDALDPVLIKEMQELNLILQPDEKILVLPADIGQAARAQAEAFHKALGITDVIITKLDATAKGGGALAACYATGAKVRFVAVGETVEDLEPYDSKRFVARLLGMPDLPALLEKAQAVAKPELAEKIIKAEFDLNDFIAQMEALQQMGPLAQMLDMLGLGGKIPKDVLEVQQSKMRRWKFMMQSMTKAERANPSIIDAPRIARIAKGSGCSEAEVRELLANYAKVKKMVKHLGLAKGLRRFKRGDLSRMFGGLKL